MKMNIIGLIASIVYALGAVFPLVSLSAFGFSQSVALIDGEDWMFVIPIGVVGVIASIVGFNVLLLIMSVFASLIAYIKFDDVLNGEYAEFYTRGLGFYLLLIGAAVMVIAAILGIINKMKTQ